VAVGMAYPDLITPPVSCRAAGAGSVFPFGFARSPSKGLSPGYHGSGQWEPKRLHLARRRSVVDRRQRRPRWPRLPPLHGLCPFLLPQYSAGRLGSTAHPSPSGPLHLFFRPWRPLAGGEAAADIWNILPACSLVCAPGGHVQTVVTPPRGGSSRSGLSRPLCASIAVFAFGGTNTTALPGPSPPGPDPQRLTCPRGMFRDTLEQGETYGPKPARIYRARGLGCWDSTLLLGASNQRSLTHQCASTGDTSRKSVAVIGCWISTE
jgi:hypothetical protein